MRSFALLVALLCLIAGTTTALQALSTITYWQPEWNDCFNRLNISGVIQIGALSLVPNLEIIENNGNPVAFQFRSESESQLKGLEFWLRTVNKNCTGITIDGARYLFNLTVVNTGEATAKIRNRTAEAMIQFPQIGLWIGPYGSGATTTSGDAVERAAQPKVMIGTGATSSTIYVCPAGSTTCDAGGRRFQRTFSPLSIAERYYVAAVNLFRTKGAKTIGFVYETSAFGTSLYTGARTEALNNRLNITLEKSTFPTPSQGNITLLVDAIIEANPDIVVCGLYYAASVEMMKQFKARNFIPKGFVTRIGDVNLANELGADSAYAIDSNFWDYRLRGEDYADSLYFRSTNASDAPAPLRWYQSFNETMGYLPGQNYEGVAFAACQVLHRAIERARSASADRVLAVLPQLQFTSFWGKITFNGFGYNELYPFAQVQYNERALPEIVYPLIASTVDLVYPIPLWEERSQRLYAYWQGSEKAIVGIASIFMIFTVALMILVAVLSNKHRVIKAASPPFLLLFLFGSLLLYTGVIMWSLYVPTAVCNAVAWCLSVGFVVMFGSLFGRTFRILQIIRKSKYAPVKFTNKRLLVFVLLLVAIDVIVLIIWTAVVPIQGVLIQPDRYRPLQDIIQCTLTNSDYIFIGILGAYKVLIMIAGLFFSVKIWNFRMSEFNESKPIAFGMYNLIFFMILAIVSVAVFDPIQQRIASYVLRSVSIMLATLITVLVIMMPKVYQVYKIPPGTETSRRPKTSAMLSISGGNGTRTTSNNSSVNKSMSSMSESELEARIGRLQKELNQVKAENRKLKAENERLKKGNITVTDDYEPSSSEEEENAKKKPVAGTKAAAAGGDSDDDSVVTEPSSDEERDDDEIKLTKSPSKGDGVQKSASKESIKKSSSKSDGIQKSSSKSDGIQKSSSKADGIQKSSSKADGIQKSSSKADGIQKSASKSDGIQKSASKDNVAAEKASKSKKKAAKEESSSSSSSDSDSEEEEKKKPTKKASNKKKSNK